MLFNQIDATRNGVLGGVAELMKVYFQPALRKQTNWGELSKMGRAGQNKINQFLESVTRFTDCLENAQKSIEGAFKLQVKILVLVKFFTSELVHCIRNFIILCANSTSLFPESCQLHSFEYKP